MLVLSTIVWLPDGAAFKTSITLRYAPGLPPDKTCAPVLLPPFPAVNWVPFQFASRNVLSETVCAAVYDGIKPMKTHKTLAPRRNQAVAGIETNLVALPWQMTWKTVLRKRRARPSHGRLLFQLREANLRNSPTSTKRRDDSPRRAQESRK